jgi:hypothetical protein
VIGFGFAETMRGNYYRLDDPTNERAIEFTIDVKVNGIRKFAKDQMATIQGVVRAEGLAEEAPLNGTLGMKLASERRLPYDFTFKGDDGETYRFRGQKDVMLIALADTMTTLPASLYDSSGKEIGRATVRFDMRSDLGRFLRSFRPKLAI